MRILLSNDDGIAAPGLAALYEAVSDMGVVSIVAPESPQSAAGHGITVRSPLVLEHVHLDDGVTLWGFSIDGRPADCVRLAIRKLLPQPAELVLAGINAGANVGVNVFYSGTVAAAAEAAMCDIPAVAFSAEITGGEVDYQRLGRLCRWVLDGLLAGGLAPGDLINVNIPALGPGRPRGVRGVRQSTAGLEDVYHRHVDDAGRETYRLGDEYSFADHQEDTDVARLAEGYITITPLNVDMTRHERLDRIARGRWDGMPQ